MSNEHYLQIVYSNDFGGGNVINNVWHVAPDAGGWTGADRTVIANYWIGRLKTFYDSCVTGGLRGGGVIGGTVIEYENDETPIYVAATAQSVGTGSGGTLQALQLAACVSWRTAKAGRSFRGRTFLGPLTVTGVSMPALAPGLVSAINAAATTLIAGASGTFKLHVVSKSGTHWHKTGSHTYSQSTYEGTSTPITSGSTTSAIRTMRSRA